MEVKRGGALPRSLHGIESVTDNLGRQPVEISRIVSQKMGDFAGGSLIQAGRRQTETHLQAKAQGDG